MGLFDFLKKEETHDQPNRFNTKPKGSSGTEIYAGYIFEEYLKDLRGTKWADKVDMMRRSDAIVKMSLRALKLPILSQNWFIEKKEESPEAERQKLLFEKVIFNDISDSFTRLLAEILTFEDFGYSVFEIVHGVSYKKEIGVYNTIKKLAYRSQRTIERFNVDSSGKLVSITQQAYGDVGRNVTIPASFLVHFAPEMEGDNYEGVSKLRSMYGPWLRKNEFLKLLAAGIEKHAIPFPKLKVPELKAESDEYDNAVEALECFTSNQSQYITFPEGWELEMVEVDFKSEKVRDVIDKENQEMVNSIMASFLLLGQSGGGGSFALSENLSDFFAQSLQASADHISEVFEKKIMQQVLDLNYAGEILKVSLRCDDLRGRADATFANTLKTFTDAGLVRRSDELEDFIREKYKYPKAKDNSILEIEGVQSEIQDDRVADSAMNGAQISSMVQVVQAVAGNTLPRDSAIEVLKRAFQISSSEAEDLLASAGNGFQIEQPESFAFAEKKSPKSKAPLLISNLADELQDFFKASIAIMSSDFITSLEKNIEQSQTVEGATSKQDDPSISNHVKITDYLISRYAVEAKKGMAQEMGVKLSERYEFSDERVKKKLNDLLLIGDRLQFDPSNKKLKSEAKRIEAELAYLTDLEIKKMKLTPQERQKLKSRAYVLVSTQSADVYKNLNLMAQSNDRLEVSALVFEVSQKTQELVNGPMSSTGASILASTIVNNTRLDFADMEEELGVESFTFQAEMDDRTSDICIELDGKTFLANDPDLEKYYPPLHPNCRSVLVPNMSGSKVKITGLGRITQKAEKSITLSEKCCHNPEFENIKQLLKH